ncbi:MAG: hypothetical protein IJ733_15945 [Lachnospiraceae bacterium]|nr:hypothetical protein [Lachnospiraceae bacterium]
MEMAVKGKKQLAIELLDSLNEDNLNMAISYIRFLGESEKKLRKEEDCKKLKQLQDMFADDKGGYDSEDDMIRDLAGFRKERMSI